MSSPIDLARELGRRLYFHLRRDHFARELDEEMRFHLDLKAQQHQAAGMSPDDARWAARRQFGNQGRLQEETAEVMAMGWLDTLAQDVRYAVRSLRKSPAFTAVAIGSVALGIGATTAVFTLVNATMLSPLPYPHPDRLVVAFETLTPGILTPSDTMPWSYQKFLRLREMVPAFADAGFSSWDEVTLEHVAGGSRSAERVRVERSSSSLFSTLGTPPLLGRTLTTTDDAGPTGAVAVLAHSLWQRQFGSDSSVIGSSVLLDGHPATIVGVMPPRFTPSHMKAEAWLPLGSITASAPGGQRGRSLEFRMGTTIARLRPGVPVAVANEQVAVAGAQLLAMYPDRFGRRETKRSAGVISLADARRHPLIDPLLLLLSVAVGGVVLIVCANIAGLLLARARTRESELGVRVALGASRRRLARQMLTESLVLAFVSAVPGLLLAWGGATLVAWLRPDLPPAYFLMRSTDLLAGASLIPDWRVLTFALLLTTLVGLAFGIAPALAATRASVADLMRSAATRSATRRVHGRQMLVVAQVAMAVTLLVGAGLMVRSVRALLRSDLAFDPRNLVVMRLAGTDTGAVARDRQANLLARLAELPGIESAAAHNCIPFASDCIMIPLEGIDGRPVERGTHPPIEVHVITDDFLRTMRIPLRAGRAFDAREIAGAPTAVLVNETAARLLWPGISPVGRRVSAVEANLEVVGVVGDAKYDAIDAPATPAFYFTERQWQRAAGLGVLYARTRGPSSAAIPSIRGEIARAMPGTAVYDANTGERLVASATSSRRFIAVLLTGFAIVAAFLAVLGVYGVLAYLVTQRTREFGVRMAIGAQPSSVLALVLRQGAALTAAGLVVGVLGALAATGVLSRFLYGVERSDALTYGVIVALLGVAGIAAAFVPAQRATRVDPVIALRE